MSETVLAAIFGSLGVILGGVLSSIVSAYVNRKNNFFQSLKHAAEALNITSEELVENLVAIKKLRQEIEEKDKAILKLEKDYKTLKEITRKLYKYMLDRGIDPELSDDELRMLYDTQPLMLFREQERKRIRNGNTQQDIDERQAWRNLNNQGFE
jgi:long-subunit acyl-CoA synthetase (AMP-forming)